VGTAQTLTDIGKGLHSSTYYTADTLYFKSIILAMIVFRDFLCKPEVNVWIILGIVE
jgi:hypothetical protein